MMSAFRTGRFLAIFLVAAALVAAKRDSAGAADAPRTVFVPSHVIYPGDTITADALVERNLVRAPANGIVFGENLQDLVGKIARRTLMPNQLVPDFAVHEKDVVVQGRPYKLVYNSEFVSIVGVGIPMQSASAGEMVSVRNPDTGLLIKARVQPDQTLTVEEQ